MGMCRASHPYALGADSAGRRASGAGALQCWQQLLQPLQSGGVGWGDRPSDSPMVNGPAMRDTEPVMAWQLRQFAVAAHARGTPHCAVRGKRQQQGVLAARGSRASRRGHGVGAGAAVGVAEWAGASSTDTGRGVARACVRRQGWPVADCRLWLNAQSSSRAGGGGGIAMRRSRPLASS